jgi:hypothetical protein
LLNIKTLKRRLVAYKFATGWSAGVVRSVETRNTILWVMVVDHVTVGVTNTILRTEITSQ